jgi:uncharacterized protein YndB with AHSA1/START domain
MSNILFELTIDAPPSEVYKAVTQVNGIKGWWTTDTSIKPEVGSTAEFRFGEQGWLGFEIVELNPSKRVVWKSTHAAAPDWSGTSVTFDLEPQNGGTKLLFGHRDFATEQGSFAGVSWQWAYFMMSLKAYVESGKGTPAGA